MPRRSILNKLARCLLLISVLAAFSAGLCSCDHSDENEVRIFSYGDYLDPNAIDMFTEETGIEVVYDTFDTNEEMYPKIKNRAGVYDIICCSDYMAERMIAEKLLQPVNKGALANYGNLDERYLLFAAESYDPGNKYAVPYQWGTLGIMYNSSRIAEGEITSWKDLWKEEYSGKIIMQDSLRDTLAAALLAGGNSINSTDSKKVNRAADALIEQKPLVSKYANDSARDFLIGGSADIGVVWNGELLYSRELNPDLKFVIPKEGTEVFFDSWCIPKNAFHVENAHKWIDFTLREDIALLNYEYLTYSSPNKAARCKMPEDVRENPDFYPSDEVLSRCEILRDLGPSVDSLYSEAWKRFKAE